MLKNTRSLLSILLILAHILVAVPVFAADTSDEVTLQILSVNDFHGALIGAGKNPGAAKLAQYIKETKSKNPNGTLILSAGDMFQGSADSNLMYGKPVVDIMNEIGFDAMAIGNHEFDWGIPVLKERQAQSKFPYLAANIIERSTDQLASFAKPYTIIEREGVRIGIIGIATPDTAYTASPKVVSPFKFTSPAKVVNSTMLEFRKQSVDIVIVLGHLSAFMDKEQHITGDAADLALSTFGIDAIIAGHSHQKVFGMVNNIPIVEAPYNGRAVGKIDLVYSKTQKKVISAEASVVTLPYPGLRADKTIEAIVAKGEAELAPIKNVVVGETLSELSHDKMQLSVLGQWVTDATRKLVKADIAIDNAGDLRTSIPAGKITMGKLYEVMPFDNTFYTVDMTGEQIIKTLEHGIYNDRFGMIQYSGIKVTYDKSKSQGQRVVAVTLPNGTKLDLIKTYKVVTNDYLFDGGDGYKWFKEGKNAVNTFLPVRESYAEQFKKAGKINVKRDDRLIEVPAINVILAPAA